MYQNPFTEAAKRINNLSDEELGKLLDEIDPFIAFTAEMFTKQLDE